MTFLENLYVLDAQLCFTVRFSSVVQSVFLLSKNSLVCPEPYTALYFLILSDSFLIFTSKSFMKSSNYYSGTGSYYLFVWAGGSDGLVMVELGLLLFFSSSISA